METKPEKYICREYSLPIGKKTYIMGILNMTPDSFSDGGRFIDRGDNEHSSYHIDIDAAVKMALDMVEQGADIIDVGGESTRPGHREVEVQEEIRRVAPVIEVLSKKVSIPISVDTSKAEVAHKALAAGAHIVNDVWGLQRDTQIAKVAATFGAGVVMMHNSKDGKYSDLIADMKAFFKSSIDIAKSAGIPGESMMIDPGIGFGKGISENLETMRRLAEFSTLGLPLLLGTSRKSMIGKVLDLTVEQRLEGTAATIALGIAYGADVVRVHDIKEMARVARMTDAIVRR